jgi:uncharacterized protein (TIGR02145 family)
MKTPLLLTLLLLSTSLTLHAQVGINADGSPPDPRTMLDVKSTSKGVLLPRLTEFQRNNLGLDVPDGMLILNITAKEFQVFLIDAWYPLSMGAAIAPPEESETISDIDGNIYDVIKIGSQYWMADNLRTTKYNDGTSIPTGYSNDDWKNLTTHAYAVFPHGSIEGLNSDAEVLEAYGALYNWYAVDDARGLCPTGWHVPTDAEWYTMENYIDNTIDDPDTEGWRGTNGGTLLKATSDWLNDGNGTNDYGFAALPDGYRWGTDGSFNGIKTDGFWRTSTLADATYDYIRTLFHQNSTIRRTPTQKKDGFSIRCIKD